MKAIKLNLEQAMRLASIISKYVDIKTSSGKGAFVLEEVAQKVPPQEYLVCISIITNKDIQEVVKLNEFDIIALFTEGFILNKVAVLLEFYEKLKNGKSG